LVNGLFVAYHRHRALILYTRRLDKDTLLSLERSTLEAFLKELMDVPVDGINKGAKLLLCSAFREWTDSSRLSYS